jgi:hypothetical protein
MCLATASNIPSLVNSVGTFDDGKLNNCCLAFEASRLAFFTASGMHRKLSGMGGVAALHLFSYTSKWWPAMWPRHVLFDPSRKQALKVLFGRTPCFIAFSVSSLCFQVSSVFF